MTLITVESEKHHYLKLRASSQPEIAPRATSETLKVQSKKCWNFMWQHSAHRSLLRSPSVHMCRRHSSHVIHLLISQVALLAGLPVRPPPRTPTGRSHMWGS